MKTFNIDNILRHYVACALWSSCNDVGEHLDDDCDFDDVAPDTLAEMREDVHSFVQSASDILERTDISEEQTGHDLWLTRNHHGAGFWDRGLGADGEALTVMAHSMGSVDLWVDDTGKVQS